MNATNYAQIILDVSKFLTDRPIDAVDLSSRERRMLELALEFLRRVLTGHQIMSDRNRLLPDLGTMSAYAFANQALRSTASGYPTTKEALFQRLIGLLEQIQDGVPLRDLPPSTVQEAQQVFDQLARFAFENEVEEIDERNTDVLGIISFAVAQ